MKFAVTVLALILFSLVVRAADEQSWSETIYLPTCQNSVWYMTEGSMNTVTVTCDPVADPKDENVD